MSEDRCKQKIYVGQWSHEQRCSRKAVRDGFCKQHHPDSVAKRKKDSEERFQRERKASPWYKIKQLQAENERLRKALQKIAEHHMRYRMNPDDGYPHSDYIHGAKEGHEECGKIADLALKELEGE